MEIVAAPIVARAVSRTLNCFMPPLEVSSAANRWPIAAMSGNSDAFVSRRARTLYVDRPPSYVSMRCSESNVASP